MDIGFHISNFTWTGGTPTLAADLANAARTAEAAGVARITVMDHFWQISMVGPAENAMLEAYTALGFLAAHTNRVLLHTLVTGVIYREPGLLAKAVTTLDVLSGGRAMLGIGAAWNDEESGGLGLPFPGTTERFDRLEEALQIVLQMWSPSEEAFDGAHYHLGRTLNSPQSLSSPRPKIMIGGSGEQKTLRLVAKYADACNLFGAAGATRKLDILRAHCEREGRDYDEIEKTTVLGVDFSQAPDAILDQFRELHDLGFTVAYVGARGLDPFPAIDVLGSKIIPEISTW